MNGSLLALYPTAELFALVDVLPDAERAWLGGRPVTTSFLQHLPLARRHFRKYLPLMPLAIEQLDVTGFDLVISSSHAVAKGVITRPDQVHLSYCHSPMRYAWDLQHQYLAGSSRLNRLLARPTLHYLRMWDVRSAFGVDTFIANSHYIRRRIEKCYRRQATVLYPPVDIAAFPLQHTKEDYYLAASRHVPYKNLPLIAAAFAAMPEKRLVMLGDGPDLARVKAIAATAPNITVLGYQPSAVLLHHLQNARALVFAAEEDFGILPVEAQACGTPVIAFGRGGSLETVCAPEGDSAPTGLFFQEQSVASICKAVAAFEASASAFSAAACRQHAERFSIAAFHTGFQEIVRASF